MAETHGITAEEIAREAAGKAVDVGTPPRSGWAYDGTGCVIVAGVYRGPWAALDVAETTASSLRAALAPVILAALERFAREVPVPGGLSTERLAEIAGTVGMLAEWKAGTPLPYALTLATYEHLRDLLTDNDHLRRALHDCGQDGTAAVWAAGFAAGRAAVAEENRHLREMLAARRGLPGG